MDIKEFYPTITKQVLDEAIAFAKRYTDISENDLRTIYHCRKSLCFFKNDAWKKKTDDSFDVTMGCYDGAEICELVGLLILDNLSKIIDKRDTGLYRDDGLILLRNASGRTTDKMRKDVINLFKTIGFQIEIITGLQSVDFLDVTLNLKSGTFCPYKKPNDSLRYVHVSSNHPQQILKQLPLSISERLSKNSSNEAVFNKSKTTYEEALKTSGYTNVELKYVPKKIPKGNKNRSRNIIWFNPPFNNNVSTNVAKKFLLLVDKHFPKSNQLHKIFNRNNTKVSYSCTDNIGKIIKSHNKNVSSTAKQPTLPCNCRKKEDCPLNGDCRKSSVIYKCEVSAPGFPKKVYIGLTEKEFKTRYHGHNQSLRNKKYANSTTLSTYVWDLKEKHATTPSLKWSIVKHTKAYTNGSRKCHLCLQEKFEILNYPIKTELLNKRSEIIAKCRHMNKFLLANYKSKD
jgi:hypothetical protein